MKTFITGLHLHGFKSFGRKSALEFSPGLNTVIGPNGSGKSNILDSLCFILGRMSSKDLRAENFSDLIFKKKNVGAGEAEISLVLDNSGGVFPYATKSIEIVRRIKKDGGTQYKINNKNATRQEILELLSLVKIHPEGHNIILQGDIARFVDMKPLEKRALIEEIAGIGTYEMRKQKALSELGKVGERLKESQIILTEKDAYLKNLEEEKKGAEQYRSMKAELASLQAAEIKLRMDLVNAKKNKTLAEIEKRDNSITNLKLEFDITKKKIEQLREKIEKLEKEIEKKGGEESLILQKEIETIKIAAEKSRMLIAASHNEIARIETRRGQLEKNLHEIEIKIREKEQERAEFTAQRKKILAIEEASKKDDDDSELRSLDEKISALDKETEKLNSELLGLKNKKSALSAELTIIEHELKSADERLRQSSRFDAKKIEKRHKEIQEEIGRLATQDSKLALDLGELKKELIKKEEELLKTKAQSSVQDILLRDRAIKELFSQKKKISGILGTVAELGKVDKEYADALSVAAGNRMKYIVVENSDAAIKCLQALKTARAGIATFLPLDKLIVDEPAEAPKKQGIIGLASELITCESKYKKVFRYIFRNTLIVDSIQTAKSLGAGKFRMVTLEGDLFEQSGAITGGFRERGIGISFEKNEFQGMLVKLESDLALLNKNGAAAEEKRKEIGEKIYELRKEKSELEGKAEFSKGFDKDFDKLEKKITELEKKKSSSAEEAKELEKEIIAYEKNLAEKTTKRNLLKLKLFGSGKKEFEAELARKSEVESQLAAIVATLENALLPEKENIAKVMQGLEKEKKTFEKQIVEEEKNLAQLDSELEGKEKDEDKFHTQFKEISEEKSSSGALLREEESKYNSSQFEITKLEHEKNNFAIERAQHEAEFAALKQELEPFVDVRQAENIKNIDDTKRRIRAMNEKIAQLGNINMRALEIFEAVKQEHENLASRVGKLSSEKDDVVKVIDEIETKKKDAFMTSYNLVAEKFKEIHAKIAIKNHAALDLENAQNPFDGGVLVKIVGEKGTRMSLAALSGGEKTLVALALIFAIQEHDPAPFYLLDEIDAALDKENSEKIAKLLHEYSQKAQIIIITHNDAVISQADNIYGVNLTKEGWSNVVSMKI